MPLNKVISVIVPIYNVEPYLDRCIQSIVDQSYPELEIILVDDGSTDECSSMCDTWEMKDKRIRVIHKENGGLSDARNAGMSAASGIYISFVDSDDWIAPETLERLLQAMQHNNSDIVACTVEMVWEDGSPGRLLTVQRNCVLNRLEAQKALLNEDLLKQPVWYKLYKREVMEGLLFEVGKYHEDVFWSYQAIGRANRVSIIDYIGYYYFQRSGSIMGADYSVKRLDAIEAKVRRQEYLETNFPELASKGRVNLWFSCLYHGQMALKYLSQEESKNALDSLKNVLKRFPLQKNDSAQISAMHRIWLGMAHISFEGTCIIRNKYRVGI